MGPRSSGYARHSRLHFLDTNTHFIGTMNRVIILYKNQEFSFLNLWFLQYVYEFVGIQVFRHCQ